MQCFAEHVSVALASAESGARGSCVCPGPSEPGGLEAASSAGVRGNSVSAHPLCWRCAATAVLHEALSPLRGEDQLWH